MVLLYLLEKEFKQFFRDPGLPKMAIAFPVLMMLVFPFAVSMEIRNIDLVVVDSNRSVASSKLVESCTASGYFNLVEVCDDPARAMQLMDRNKADAQTQRYRRAKQEATRFGANHFSDTRIFVAFNQQFNAEGVGFRVFQ